MGLLVCIGTYSEALIDDPDHAKWLEKQFLTINTVLEEKGYSKHSEPTGLGNLYEKHDRSWTNSFSYGTLFQFREFYSDTISNLDTHMTFRSSHLLCHSDYCGFYLPIKFNEVIEDQRIAGNWLGSSYSLMSELVLIAPSLGIKLNNGVLDSHEIKELNDKAWSNTTLSTELMAWITLFESARLSIEFNTAILYQ